MCFLFARTHRSGANLVSSGHVWYAVDQDDMTEKVDGRDLDLDAWSFLSLLVPSTTMPGDSGR